MIRRNRSISNTDDIIDSRDVIARIDELDSDLRARYDDDQPPAEDDEAPKLLLPFDDWLESLRANDDEDANELKILQELANDGEGSPDWNYGETLIRDSYFETYARDLAEDCSMRMDQHWPNMFIDWEAAAEALQADYMSVDFDGVTYWIRA